MESKQRGENMGTAAYRHDNLIKIDFNMTPLFDGIKAIRNDAINLKILYRVYKFLNILEKYISYAVVTKDDIESVEKALEIIDDTLDDLEEKIDNANFIHRFLLNKILSKLLTIQFILSNKIADYIGENHQNKSV